MTRRTRNNEFNIYNRTRSRRLERSNMRFVLIATAVVTGVILVLTLL